MHCDMASLDASIDAINSDEGDVDYKIFKVD